MRPYRELQPRPRRHPRGCLGSALAEVIMTVDPHEKAAIAFTRYFRASTRSIGRLGKPDKVPSLPVRDRDTITPREQQNHVSEKA